MNAVAKISPNASAVVEQVLVSGDLSKLTPDQRVEYYHRVCESVGLNPLTKPFEYITLNGKLTLYALRGCTDQLRSVHNVSVEEMTDAEREGVCIVTVKVRNASGRTDVAKGAVHIAGLKGEALANAIMKAETKAKRRATLSICGLGWLDETEVETIPGPHREKLTPPPAPKTTLTPEEEAALDRQAIRNGMGETDEEPHTITTAAKSDREWGIELVGKYKASADLGTLMAWHEANEKIIDQLGPKAIQSLKAAYDARYAEIVATMGPSDVPLMGEELVP